LKLLWVKFISAFLWQKQLFSAHTIGRILFVRILEVSFGKTQFSSFDDIFHLFLEGVGGVKVIPSTAAAVKNWDWLQLAEHSILFGLHYFSFFHE
jgi:hypothetical protein